MPPASIPIEDLTLNPPVRGFLQRPEGKSRAALVLTHSAGGNCQSPLLRALADALSDVGICVLRCDLPFRQKRAHGAPLRSAEEDRAGLRNAASLLRRLGAGPLFLGGHSYGGRQASMLAAQNEDASVADGLLLLSYPLHPPRQPAQLRTAHFPALHVPALLVHGTRDGFGSIAEIQAALQLIPAATRLLPVEGAGHDLHFGRRSSAAEDVLPAIVAAFLDFFAVTAPRR